MPRLLSKVICFIPLLFALSQVYAQSPDHDLRLIRQVTTASLTVNEPHSHPPAFLLSDHPSPWVRYNPGTLFFGGLMWMYQSTITRHLSSSCIYSPTCSAYSKSLIHEFGLLPGIIFTADRLTRCNRLALYDYPEAEVDHQIHRIRQDEMYYRMQRK